MNWLARLVGKFQIGALLTGAAPLHSPILPHVNRVHLLPKSQLMRLGTVYGGWNLPKNLSLNPQSICYMAGAGEDISFDCEMVTRFRCKIRIIDPTPRAIEHFKQLQLAVSEGRAFPINGSQTDFYNVSPVNLPLLTFLPFGLSNQDSIQRFYFPKNPAHVSCSIVNLQNTAEYFEAECQRLSTLMLAQRDSAIDLLKINIEGAEYAVLADLLKHNLLPKILLVVFDEGHTPMDEMARDRIGNHIAQLQNAGMRCVALEGCNATFIGS